MLKNIVQIGASLKVLNLTALFGWVTIFVRSSLRRSWSNYYERLRLWPMHGRRRTWDMMPDTILNGDHADVVHHLWARRSIDGDAIEAIFGRRLWAVIPITIHKLEGRL